MTGPLSIVRVALLGALLCTLASLQHASGLDSQRPAPTSVPRGLFGTLTASGEHSANSVADSSSVNATERESDAPRRPCGPAQDSEEDGGGNLDSDDDFDLEDVLSHPRLYLECQPAASAKKPPVPGFARAHVRLEDCRFEKPPRA
jgi:hypothetical protein